MKCEYCEKIADCAVEITIDGVSDTVPICSDCLEVARQSANL
jgi:hypothetical protein